MKVNELRETKKKVCESDNADCIHLALDENEWQAGYNEYSYRAPGSVKSGEFLD